MDIDGDCRNALASGSIMRYLWLSSRGSAIPEEIKQRFLLKAISLGFDISRLECMAQ
ncbi:lipocalin family protein [Mucilaginibacter gossypii]|uniref:lipocalin family protein n=1 Tax=Mucilaginibacter gossypii TaxID=551996 RepID=UPI0015A23B06